MHAQIVNEVRSTLPATDDHPYRTGFWRPQTREWDVEDCDVTGELPDDLAGVYLRNTENPLHPAVQVYHPFDGDGMLHAVGFEAGRAWYRNRFVRTDGYLAEQQAGRSLWAGLAEDPTTAASATGWGARGRMKDASSTDVVVHAGKAVTSFYQCGDLYRLDPRTLHTEGKAEWVEDAWGVSAHSRVDPTTGELLFFSYGTEAPYLRFGVVDAGEHLTQVTDVPLPGPRLPHDLAFTEHYAILSDFPLFWPPEGIAAGRYAPRYHPDLPSRLAVVRRRGGEQVRFFEAEPTFVLHWVNAYEDGDEIVLEGFFEDDPQPHVRGGTPYERLFRFLDSHLLGTHLHRWRLDLRSGLVKEERLTDTVSEFGVISTERWGRPHRYSYAASPMPGWFLFDGIIRHDSRTGAEERWSFGPGVVGSEVAVVDRPGAVDEDDCYLVTITSDLERDSSACLVFHGADLAAGPIATVALPERVASGTHATWASSRDIPDWPAG